jgi:4-hydroxybenzoate polyprenyltransferase
LVSTAGSKTRNPYLDLLRPEIADMDLALPAASALLASYIAAGSLPELLPFIIAVIGGYAAITSSYVYNDCCDVDVDRINLPDRPLASAVLSRKQGLTYAGILALVASAAALWLNPESFVVLVIAVLTVSIYSRFAKRSTFFSFIPVGISYGLVPVGIWLAFDPAGILKGTDTTILPLPGIFLGIMMCVTDWGFTLAGVSRDEEGDRLRNVPTFPVTFGIPATARFIALCWFAGVISSLIIGWTARLGPLFFLVAIIAGAWMLSQAVDFIKNPIPERGGKLFLQGSRYRGVMFGSLIIDVILSVTVAGYVSIFW